MTSKYYLNNIWVLYAIMDTFRILIASDSYFLTLIGVIFETKNSEVQFLKMHGYNVTECIIIKQFHSNPFRIVWCI